MSTPRVGGGRPAAYKTADGKRVPGVTTIVSRFKESGGLVHWAWQLGIDGKDYRRERDNAASAGTIGHALIDADIHSTTAVLPSAQDLNMTWPDYTEALERAQSSLKAFQEWRKSVSLEIVVTEVPFVSETYKFGGTLDAIARIAGKLALFDWKTSNRIYHDYIIQVSAYRALWEEHNPNDKIEGLHLVRVDKEFGSFAHHSWPIPVLDKGWQAFKLMRELYDIDAVLKRAAA